MRIRPPAWHWQRHTNGANVWANAHICAGERAPCPWPARGPSLAQRLQLPPASPPARPPCSGSPPLPAAPVTCVRFILRALLSGAVLAGWSGRPAARRDSRRTSVIAPSAQSSRCQTLPLRQGSSRCAAGTGPVQRTSPGCETGGGRDVRRLAGPTCGQAPSKLILGSGLRIEGAGELQNAVLQC